MLIKNETAIGNMRVKTIIFRFSACFFRNFGIAHQSFRLLFGIPHESFHLFFGEKNKFFI
ncbi:hypothetical protein FZC77_19760 [Bacillus swezeyi]|uniref:Uncharacterized protein n=1 Tax=Bacillus swezeyi TaxID=1925020 RepID=A0A5M8RN07_9BACI|nr:hypothetical protein DX927_16595 [Bacillus swezeyi]KAA6474271.1 hypothetical protein DX928_16905 [Bacillus swezeyi]TYS33516.1 hypothetical protein FZC77_19760 [Bacillus swezeyi]